MESERWRAKALCRQFDAEDFFPDDKRDAVQRAKRAKRVCGRCPVRLACRAYALNWHRNVGDLYGVWGGMTRRERKAVIKSERAKQPV